MKVTPENLGSAFNQILSDVQKKTVRACQNTVNIQAAMTRKNAIENINQKFILRNNFTTRNITYTQCPKSVTRFNDIESHVGATEKIEYMKRQEEGGIRTSDKPGKPLAIPTTRARGGSPSNQIRSKYRLNQMQTVKYLGGKNYATRSSHFVAMAQIASTKKLLLNFKKGIYEVTGFKSLKSNVSFNLHLIRNKAYTQTTTPAKPWLEPAMEQPARDSQQIFNQEMSKL